MKTLKDLEKGFDLTMFKHDYVYKMKNWSPKQGVMW